VGLYDPTHYRAIYAMGDAYRMPADGTALTGLYGLFFAYDNPSYKNVSGRTLGHGFGLAENGVVKFYCGAQGMWHTGPAYASDFILT
jgi:trimeric autotransporter adhesin